MANVKAVKSESVNGNYVMTDRTTGNVVDDNQGYGYKTADKAYKCYGWKQARRANA